MHRIIKSNPTVKETLLSCYVRPNTATPVTVNRSSHALLFQAEGENIFTIDSKNIYLQKGNILFLPKGLSYSIDINISTAGGAYAINFNTFEDIEIPPFILKTRNSAAFFNAFKNISKISVTKPTGYQFKCKSILYDILSMMAQEYTAVYVSGKAKEILNPAIEYIYEEYTSDNISIAHLAELCKLSESYFRVLFKKVMGTSPLKFINNLKISRAKDLIESEMYPISKIAELSGFHNESYFSREFKKATGISPSQYLSRTNRRKYCTGC